jgi:hypothetical protein
MAKLDLEQGEQGGIKGGLGENPPFTFNSIRSRFEINSGAFNCEYNGAFMNIVSFSVSYARLLLDVMLGQRRTPYPLGVLWRWRHKRYADL